MDPRSVAVWPNGLGSDKHANKEETGGEGGGGAGKDPPKVLFTVFMQHMQHTYQEQLSSGLIITYPASHTL